MRRFIAYSMLAASMLVAVGVAASPVLTKMNAGREFNNGYEITFKVESLEEGQELGKDAGNEVAQEMSNRLAAFNFEDYSVKVQNGYDDKDLTSQTISVSFSCEQKIFNDVCKYLTFSGTNFTFTDATESGKVFDDHDQIDYANVRIEQIKDRIPVVVIPLTKQGQEDLEDLTKVEATEETTKALLKRDFMVNADDEGDVTEEPAGNSDPEILVWGNYIADEDNYPASKTDPNVYNRIIAGFSKASIWYTVDDGAPNDYAEGKDKYHTAIKIVCGSMTSGENGESSYDFTKISDANLQATYFKCMFTASKYDYKISCPSLNITQTGGYDYLTNALLVEPANEYLVVESKLAMNVVLITTLIAIAVISVCVAIYYKLFSIGVIATTISTIFISALATVEMGILFNVPFLIGLILVAACSLFGEILYISKAKEEVYKGRSLKKANQEASKKSNLIVLDATIVLAITGLLIYLLGGVALKPLGAVLFFGSIISLAMNLIVFKILMYLVTNSFDLQSKYGAFGINKDKIPNLMLEQKPTYVAPLEKVNFTKKSKIAGIILAALSGISLVGILAFGIMDKTPLNIANATKDTTVIYTTLYHAEDKVEDESTFKEYILKDIDQVKDGLEAQSVDMKDIEVLPDDYKADSSVETVKSKFFVVKISDKLTDEQILSLKEKVSTNIVDNVTTVENDYKVEIYNVKELVYTPNQGLVALATGISIIAVSVYFMFRFRPSRGLSIFVTTLASSTVAYGLLAITRIGTTAVASVAMPVVSVITMLLSLFYLSTEKAMFKESKKDLSKEERAEIMKAALGKAALPSLAFLVFAVYVSVNYFGFGLESTTFLFVSMLIGVIVGALSLFMISGPLAEVFASWLSKVRLPKFKSNKKDNPGIQKQKTSEPEETIFIGIND